MDVTDFQILGHLFQHPLDGSQAIAHEVGLTRNAVARRVRNLQEDVGLTFFALPHQDLFSRRSTVNLYMADNVDENRLWACESVLAYDLNHDGLLAVTTWTENGQRPAELDECLGGAPTAHYMDTAPGPAAPFLTRLDWRVVRAIMRNPRASTAELARSSGLAPRTCSRARDRLTEGNAIRVGINVCEDRSQGYPIYRLYVHGTFPRQAIQERLGPDTVISDTVEEGCVYFAHASSLGSIMTSVKGIQGEEGVEDVKLILSRQAGVNNAWLDELVEQKITASPTQPSV